MIQILYALYKIEYFIHFKIRTYIEWSSIKTYYRVTFLTDYIKFEITNRSTGKIILFEYRKDELENVINDVKKHIKLKWYQKLFTK